MVDEGNDLFSPGVHLQCTKQVSFIIWEQEGNISRCKYSHQRLGSFRISGKAMNVFALDKALPVFCTTARTLANWKAKLYTWCQEFQRSALFCACLLKCNTACCAMAVQGFSGDENSTSWTENCGFRNLSLSKSFCALFHTFFVTCFLHMTLSVNTCVQVGRGSMEGGNDVNADANVIPQGARPRNHQSVRVWLGSLRSLLENVSIQQIFTFK